MDRSKAVEVVKKLLDSCRNIEGKSLKLMPPDADSILSKGCQIHIDGRNDAALEVCLKTLVNKNGLRLVKEGELLVIYRANN